MSHETPPGRANIIELSGAAYQEIVDRIRESGFGREFLESGMLYGYRSTVVRFPGYKDRSVDSRGLVLAKAGDHT